MEYEVIFYDYVGDEVVVKQKFLTKQLANNWAFCCEYDYDDIAIDENGNEYWKTFYKYFNLEDKETYVGYRVRGLSELRKEKLESLNLKNKIL